MRHLGDLLSAYLDGETTPAESAQVVEHLQRCRPCRSELDEIHQARSTIRALTLLEPPPGLLPDELGVVVPIRRRRRWMAGMAAAVVVAVVGVATALAPSDAVPISVAQLSDQYGARSAAEPGVTPAKLMVPLPAEEAE